MKLSSKSFLTTGLACGFIIAVASVCAASEFALPEEKTSVTLPFAVTTIVEKRTAKINVSSEPIQMTARVGELWQVEGDVLYQTSNLDVTDLATGEDGRDAVEFTKPGEAVIRVYIRKNGEVYVQDFQFTIQEPAGDFYANGQNENNNTSGASWPQGRGNGSEGASESGASPSMHTAPSSDSVYAENNRGAEAFPEEVLQLVNQERAKVGVRPLRLNDELLEGAMVRAEEITRHFSHDRPDGTSCFTVLSNQNSTLGENIAAGSATPEAVVDQWMHSPGHRANILNKDFKELGVGYYYKEDSTYKHYWIQMFRG